MNPNVNRFALALAALLLLAAGCSTVTVGKAKMRPIGDQVKQTLRLKFWRFEYTAQTRDGQLEIKGAAYPVREKFPDWADWIDDFKLSAYLCDNQGKVLASEEMAYQPHALDTVKGAPFRFAFKKDSKTEAATNLTFGYQSRLTSHTKPRPDGQEFLAIEPAMVRY